MTDDEPDAASRPFARLTTFHAALLAFALTAAPGAGAAPFAYVTNQASHDVSVVDLATDRNIATVPVDRGPAGVAVANATGSVFVAHPEAGTIAVIDMRQQRVTQRLRTVEGSGGPMGLAASADGRQLLATDWAHGALWIYDVSAAPAGALREIARVPVGRYPAGVAWSPDGREAYVAERDDDTVAVVDIRSASVRQRIRVGRHPFALMVDGPRQRLYALNVYSNDISVIDLRRHEVVRSVAVGKAPYGAALSSDGQRLFVTNQQADSVSMLDAESLRTLGTLDGFGYPEGIAANGDEILVVNWMDDELSVLDGRTGRERARVRTGQNSRGFGAFVGAPEVR